MSLARDKSGWRLWLAMGTGVLLGFMLACAGGAHADRPAAAAELPAPNPSVSADALPWQDARQPAEVLQRVRESYLDKVDDHVLMRQAAHGLVASLDEHTELLEADDYARLQSATDAANRVPTLAHRDAPVAVALARLRGESAARRQHF